MQPTLITIRGSPWRFGLVVSSLPAEPLGREIESHCVLLVAFKKTTYLSFDSKQIQRVLLNRKNVPNVSSRIVVYHQVS
jgi:hypothetical protein